MSLEDVRYSELLYLIGLARAGIGSAPKPAQGWSTNELAAEFLLFREINYGVGRVEGGDALLRFVF